MAASKEKPATPQDELLARFQLQNERDIGKLRTDLTRLHEGLAMKVAQLTDVCTQMTQTVDRQTAQLEDAVHHTREGVKECNLALKESAKAAREAADSAAVFEKLKDSQPDFAAQVRALEVRLASVVDNNKHLHERLDTLGSKLEEFELVAGEFESTAGEVRGLDMAVKRLDHSVRTARPL